MSSAFIGLALVGTAAGMTPPGGGATTWGTVTVPPQVVEKNEARSRETLRQRDRESR